MTKAVMMTEMMIKATNFVRDSEPTPKDEIGGKIISYLALAPDWDGYGGVPPSNQAVGDALMWLQRLPVDCAQPKPMLSGSGEVGLYWDRNGFYCDIGFLGDGTLSYHAEAADGSSLGKDNVDLDESSVSLLAFLSRIGADVT